MQFKLEKKPKKSYETQTCKLFQMEDKKAILDENKSSPKHRNLPQAAASCSCLVNSAGPCTEHGHSFNLPSQLLAICNYETSQTKAVARPSFLSAINGLIFHEII